MHFYCVHLSDMGTYTLQVGDKRLSACAEWNSGLLLTAHNTDFIVFIVPIYILLFTCFLYICHYLTPCHILSPPFSVSIYSLYSHLVHITQKPTCQPPTPLPPRSIASWLGILGYVYLTDQ